VCFDHLNVTFFHSKLLPDNSASFTSSTTRDSCRKSKVKLIFRGEYRLSGTGIVECLEVIDVECSLKQFDGSTRLPHILRQIYAIASCQTASKNGLINGFVGTSKNLSTSSIVHLSLWCSVDVGRVTGTSSGLGVGMSVVTI